MCLLTIEIEFFENISLTTGKGNQKYRPEVFRIIDW